MKSKFDSMKQRQNSNVRKKSNSIKKNVKRIKKNITGKLQIRFKIQFHSDPRQFFTEQNKLFNYATHYREIPRQSQNLIRKHLVDKTMKKVLNGNRGKGTGNKNSKKTNIKNLFVKYSQTLCIDPS